MLGHEIFNEVPLFKLLDDDERDVLAKQVSIKKFKKGQTIFKEGDAGGLAYVIQKGVAHVTIKDAGHETIVVDIADEGIRFACDWITSNLFDVGLNRLFQNALQQSALIEHR